MIKKICCVTCNKKCVITVTLDDEDKVLNVENCGCERGNVYAEKYFK